MLFTLGASTAASSEAALPAGPGTAVAKPELVKFIEYVPALWFRHSTAQAPANPKEPE